MTTSTTGSAATSTAESTATSAARSRLDELAEGALRWLDRNLAHFDPFTGDSPLPENRRVKALLELAIFHRAWTGLQPPTRLHDRAGALLREVWPRPELPLLVEEHGGPYACSQWLAYLALAPVELPGAHRARALDRLRAANYLDPAGKPVQVRLEIRYLAETAGVEHGVEPYPDLAAHGPLTVVPDTPMSTAEAYTLTHTAFYLADYGCRGIDLPPEARARAAAAVGAMLGSCVRQDKWDLTGELLITLACLGEDVAATPAGRAGIERLAAVQRPDGALPGRSAGSGVDPALPPPAFFRRVYHPTLVVALMSLILRRRA